MAQFFLTSALFDEAELIDFLLNRYHTLEFMNNMPVETFCRVYKTAVQKDKEEKIRQQWCAMLPKLNKYMTFEAFKELITGSNIDLRPTEEILKDIRETHAKAKENKDGIRDI